VPEAISGLLVLLGLIAASLVLLRIGSFQSPNAAIATVAPESVPVFPWPPPRASARVVIPARLLPAGKDHQTLLRDIDEKLVSALQSAGYVETSYYAVPDGFALVTRLEHITQEGAPEKGKQRWIAHIEPVRLNRDFTLSAYLAALFGVQQGFYRVIVFIVTPHPFAESHSSVSEIEAEDWRHSGLNVLPQGIASLAYTQQYSCTALIYEFQQPGNSQQVRWISLDKSRAKITS
jgi:hypothetical protein